MNLPGHPELVTWLLEGDPALRWQVLEDLTDASDAEVSTERQRVAWEGWGARLLAEHDEAGTWAQGLYLPKWTSTTYTLLLLQRLGLAPGNIQALAGCKRLWDGARYTDGGLNLVYRSPETCVTGMLVLLGSYFGYQDQRIDAAVSWLLRDQLSDGGWNCQARRKGSRHGSFHSTITVLEALLAYRRSGGAVLVEAAADCAEEFFLRHHLYRSHRTGEVANEEFLRFPFPPQWHFDILRGLEYFRACGNTLDPRLADAVEQVRLARRPDGTWKRYRPYPGFRWFPLEEPGASRITSLRCLRVLRWWDAR
ncbi:hypothetical protein [Arthrobacter methylotrophus]|uniref:Squalene cyclase C-terminal domain-containing protein n=1 Tax=Arthrobacter methylotrophus TaxID=121291 RepID=A0ABV5UXD3_9MICC